MLLFAAWFYGGEAQAQFSARANETKGAIYGSTQAERNSLRVTASNVPLLRSVDYYECFIGADANYVPVSADFQRATCGTQGTGTARTLSALPVQHGMNYVHFRAVTTPILGSTQTSTAAMAFWFVDLQVDSPYARNVAPNGEVIVVPGADGRCSAPVTVSIVMENASHLSYRVDGGETQIRAGEPYPTPESPPFMFDYELVLTGHSLNGGQSLSLSVWTHLDRFGHSEPEPTTPWIVRCESSGPMVSINGPADGFSTTAQLSFSSAEATAFYCRLDGAAFAPCTSPMSYTGLSAGVHTFEVYGVDGNGLQGLAASHSWEVLLPSVIWGELPTDSSATTVVFEFSSNDPNAWFECSLDTAAFLPCTSLAAVQNLTQGQHTFRVRAVNDAGRGPANSHTWTVLPSINPLVVVIETPANNSMLSSLTTVTGTAPAGSSVYLVLSNGTTQHGVLCGDANTAGNWTCTVPTSIVLSAGTWQATVVAVLGNDSGSDSVNIGIVAAGAYPEVRITRRPQSTDRFPRFEFEGTNTAGFICQVDDGPEFECQSPWEADTPLSLGEHTFRVWGVDNQGRRGQPAEHRWEVVGLADLEIRIERPVEGGSYPARFSQVVGSASPGIVRVLLCLDGDCTTTTCTVHEEAFVCTFASTLDDGNHTIVVTGYDVNSQPSNELTVNFSIDSSLPTVTIEHDQENRRLRFHSSKPGSSFECSINGSAYERCESPYDITGFPDGEYTISVRAIDSLGQQGEESTYTWTQTGSTIDPLREEPWRPYMVSGGADIGCSSASGAPLAMLALAFWALARRRRRA